MCGNEMSQQLKVNSKTFASPILTAILSSIIKADTIKIGIANAVEIISVLKQPLSFTFNLFSYYLIPNLFA